MIPNQPDRDTMRRHWVWRIGITLGLGFGILAFAEPTNLVSNPHFLPNPGAPSLPLDFTMSGNVSYGELGDLTREYSGRGVRFDSSLQPPQPHLPRGRVSTRVTGVSALHHRWFRLRIRALAQPHFAVKQDELFLQVEFFGTSPANSLDQIKSRIFPQLRREREDLKDPSANQRLGQATWRTYEMAFRTPFPEVDSLILSAGFSLGIAQQPNAEFWINEFRLEPIPTPTHFRPRHHPVRSDDLSNLLHLGGRWYYHPSPEARVAPAQFDHTNAHRLLYLSDRLEAPFADNTSAWLRDGYYDARGALVKQARFLPENVVIQFTPRHMIVHSHNLPNHPTAFFPDLWRTLDGNPNRIQEILSTWHLPLDPTPSTLRVAMTPGNQNQALPGGPIGVAVNGVVFFNPYDLERNQDAIWRLDRCCGHPSPRSQYHYHKYPVCIKSPWSDDGNQHSPLIGFAFDGFPIYGPYESKGELAKNSTPNPLNEFNVHHDADRGWHYHVTPGAFPHIIGGYWGTADPNNHRTRRPRDRRGRTRR